MIIEIIQSELTKGEGRKYWACWLQITQDEESYFLPATAPGTLAEEELQVYFDAHEDELWSVAQNKGYEPDILKQVPSRRLLKALALVILDELNFIRENPGFHEAITVDEMIAAVKEKLR